MKVSGFTVIRNAEIMGYPIVESIKSLLPLVDEFVIGVGVSEDKTRDVIENINNPKIKIFDSLWDTSKTKGGLILSEKTNEALEKCEGDWCFYLQADEVIHEGDYPKIKESLEKFANVPEVEGLIFSYNHFYGAYNVVATARNWYRHEVRVIKKSSGAKSVGDAQGFRVGERKPRVVSSGGRIFHYGWVKPPRAMGEKNKHMFRWWHGNKFDNAFKDFAYKASYGLKYFKDSHPLVMKALVERQDWHFDPRGWRFRDWNLRDLKNVLSDLTEKITRQRLGEHKNYVLFKGDI
jgi:hypothetical protein